MTTQRIQLLITEVLAFVLLVLVASYIYYGMQLAKRTNSVAAAKGETETATETVPPQMTREEKLAILNSLSTDSTTTISSAEKESILDNLAKDRPVVTMSEAEKQKILEQLSR